MSATIACSDFLHTSGQCPASLRMPPACPPMPSAHVLQAFFERIAFHSLKAANASGTGDHMAAAREMSLALSLAPSDPGLLTATARDSDPTAPAPTQPPRRPAKRRAP